MITYLSESGYPDTLIQKEATHIWWGISADRTSKDKKNMAVAYYLQTMGPAGIIADLAEYRIYNENGIEIGSFSSYLGGGMPVASRDGRWMACAVNRYSDFDSDEIAGRFSMAFFDTGTGRLVFEDTTAASEYVFAVHDYFGNRGGDYFSAYFPDKEVKYDRSFTVDVKAAAWDDFEIDGVYASTYVRTRSKDIGVIRTNRKRLYFEKDFEISPLKRIEQ